MNMKPITLDTVKSALDSLGYANISTAHIIGFRMPRKGNICTDRFDDYICVIADDTLYGPWKCTTLPGLYYLEHPMNGHDTCFIYPGQYINCFQKGLYKNYMAIRQIRSIKYYTDANKDNIFNMDNAHTQTAIRYTHIHKAGKDSKIVSTWSAACQVIANAADFDEFMKSLDNKGTGVKNDIYTYTLLNWE